MFNVWKNLRKTLRMVQMDVKLESFQLKPPARVRGMTKWEPKLFENVLTLPHVELSSPNISNSKARKILKECKLAVRNFPSMRNVDNGAKKRVILDPDALAKLSLDELAKLKNNFNCVFGEDQHTFDYTNYDPGVAIQHVLPEDDEGRIQSNF